MKSSEFYARLENDDLEVTFTKVSTGEVRKLRCTANVPQDQAQTKANIRPNSWDLVTVFDIDARSWRSFYMNRVIDVKPLDTQYQYLKG